MRPRVVVLTTYFRPVFGGVESNAERLARYLQAHGFDVLVLTKRVTPDLPDVEERDGVRVRRIGPSGARNGYGKWRLLPHAAWWLIAHRHDYDVVCCVDFRGVGLAALAARAITGRRVLFQAQTPGVFKWPVRWVYRHADILGCIGHALEDEALAAGVPRDRIRFLPNAIDMTVFRPALPDERVAIRRSLDVPPDHVLCVFLGRLSLEKGLMDLMEAWRILPVKSVKSGAILLVAGPDMEGHPWNVGPAAREFSRGNALESSVRFIGPCADPAALVRAADVFVQPSHFEAQGLSAVEALASGVPVIASAVGGLLDFVKDGVNGRLAPPKAPTALAACLSALIEDAPLRQRLAAAARSSVVTDYDEHAVFGQFVTLLRDLAGIAT